MNSKPETAKATAVHEAGHAYMLRHRNVGLRSVYVVREPTEHESWVGKVCPVEDEIPPEIRAEVLLAGPMAEIRQRAGGKIDPDWPMVELVEAVLAGLGNKGDQDNGGDVRITVIEADGNRESVPVTISGFVGDFAEAVGVWIRQIACVVRDVINQDDAWSRIEGLADALLKTKRHEPSVAQFLVEEPTANAVLEKWSGGEHTDKRLVVFRLSGCEAMEILA